MLISARESSRILAAEGLSRQQSRRVLLSGLAGEGVRTGGLLLYDEHQVRALARWSPVSHESLLEACPGGVVVVRLGPGEEPDPIWSWEQRVAAFRIQPFLGFAAWLGVNASLSVHGRLACAVTVCGYPVLLADAVSCRESKSQVELGLEPAGPWSQLLSDRRLTTGPGPRWLLLGSQPYLGRASRARERGEPVNAGRSTTWSRWA